MSLYCITAEELWCYFGNILLLKVLHLAHFPHSIAYPFTMHFYHTILKSNSQLERSAIEVGFTGSVISSRNSNLRLVSRRLDTLGDLHPCVDGFGRRKNDALAFDSFLPVARVSQILTISYMYYHFVVLTFH